jgi:hypothetical protein
VGELLGGSQLHAGPLTVAVDLPQGPQAAAETAAISDAIASLNSQVAALGVTLVETSGASSAQVHIAMAATSPIGGVGQGVLGAYAPDGDITLISGWNWYFGAGSGTIASNQYDFQTVVTHELGHALGLGENSDPASAMSLYLSPGQIRHDLTATDLAAIGQELQPSLVASVFGPPVLSGVAAPAALSPAALDALFGSGGPVQGTIWTAPNISGGGEWALKLGSATTKATTVAPKSPVPSSLDAFFGDLGADIA